MPVRLLPITLLLLLFRVVPLHAQTHLTKKYSVEQCIAVTNDVIQAINDYHPGAWRYQSKASFTHYADSLRATIKEPLTELELYRKIKPLAMTVGCLHTDLSTAAHYKGTLNEQPNLFPFQLFFEKGRAYVIRNFSGVKEIVPGDELLQINGRTTAAIVQQILPAIPSDGHNLTMKYLALYHSFPTWYRSMIEVVDSFSITVLRDGREQLFKVAGKKSAEISGDGFIEEPKLTKPLDFAIRNNTGFLTIQTFANSQIKKAGFKFKEYIDQAFDSLRSQSVNKLVIDLRYNTGGSDGNAAYFSSYFFDKPYRYWDRIEVTEKIAKETKGFARLFYRKPVQRDSIWLWQKGKTASDFDYYEEQQPAKHPYNGKVYVLINGFCMSSCTDLTALLSYHKKAVFVGEETGGGFQGNNSGIMPGINLRPTKMVFKIPLQGYYMAVDPSLHKGQGTLPDYRAPLTLQDILGKKDRAMEMVMELVEKS